MEGLIAAIVICLGIIICMVLKRVLFLRNGCKQVGYILIPCSGKTKNLEKTVRAYYWEEVFENECLAREIIIVLMDKSENSYAAKRLAQQFVIVSAVDITGLEDYLKKKFYSCNS